MTARILPQGFVTKEDSSGSLSSPSMSFQSSDAYTSSAEVTTPTVQRQWPQIPDSRSTRFAWSHTKPHSIWRVTLLAKHIWRKHRGDVLTAVFAEETAEPVQDLRNCTMSFILSLFLLGVVSTYLGSQFKSDAQPEDDLTAARGRACWTYCCGGSVFLLSLLTFLITLFLLSAAKTHPKEAGRGPQHPGERAFEAGEGVALSVACFAILILRRRHAASLHISTGLISQFAVRGATLSVIVATILELLGILGVNYVTGTPPRDLVPSDNSKAGGEGMLFVSAAMMGVVGLTEEFSKAIALLCGTWISASALRASQPSWRPWRLLVESPRGIMLAGLSVGCGFMTMENFGYLLSTGLMYDKHDSVLAERISRFVIVFVRVGLNLHPWLAGITSARVARICFEDGRNTLSLSLPEFAWALAPSVVLHSLFDFSLVALPGIVAMALPLVFWLTARWLFNKEWAAFEERALESSDPVEETTSAHDS